MTGQSHRSHDGRDNPKRGQRYYGCITEALRKVLRMDMTLKWSEMAKVWLRFGCQVCRRQTAVQRFRCRSEAPGPILEARHRIVLEMTGQVCQQSSTVDDWGSCFVIPQSTGDDWGSLFMVQSNTGEDWRRLPIVQNSLEMTGEARS